MPPLAGVTHAVIESPADHGEQRFPIPWPGMPNSLEVLSATERTWWGNRFGIDTPYYATPAGWGEWIPLFGFDVAGVHDVVVLDPNAEREDALAEAHLFPRPGLFPRLGLFPRHA
jgi:hypothetical protein